MRFIQFAAAFLTAIHLVAAHALAYEAEKEMLFQGTGDDELRIISTTDIELFQPLIEAFSKGAYVLDAMAAAPFILGLTKKD